MNWKYIVIFSFLLLACTPQKESTTQGKRVNYEPPALPQVQNMTEQQTQEVVLPEFKTPSDVVVPLQSKNDTAGVNIHRVPARVESKSYGPFCHEIIPGHNQPDETRDSIIIIPDGFKTEELGDFRQMVPQNLGVTGDDRGLFSHEPFKSNLDRFNFYYIDNAYQLNCTDVSAYPKDNCDGITIAPRINSECGIDIFSFEDSSERDEFDKIMVGILINRRNETGYTSSAARWFLKRNLRLPTAKVFVNLKRSESYTRYDEEGIFSHEFGHLFGLGDEYLSYTRGGQTNIVNDPNCDIFPCPKWCANNSKFKNPYNQESTCNEISDEKQCMAAVMNGYKCDWNGYEAVYVQGSKPCHVMFADKEDLKANNQNLGKDCIAGTGCYYGCGGKGIFRSTLDHSVMEYESSNGGADFNEVSKRYLCQKIEGAKGYCTIYN